MPAPDDDDHRSRDLIKQHHQTLIAEAVDILRERPDLRLVGVVIEPDAPEVAMLQRFLQPESMSATAGFVGVMERSIAVSLLGGAMPALLDWLHSEEADGVRQLPVIHLAHNGARTAALKWPDDG